MGSCLSRCSGTKTLKDGDHDRRRLQRDRYARQDRASSTDEEPVVKEVLSETTKPSFPVPKAQGAKSGEIFAKPAAPAPLVEALVVGSADVPDGVKAEVEPPEAETEVSEICSVSETVSVSTTVTDRGEMEEESRRRVVEHRSPNGAAASVASGGPRYRKRRSLSGELVVPRRDPRRGGVGAAGGGRYSRSPVRRLADAGGASEYGTGRAFSCGKEGADRSGQPVAPRLARRDPGERSDRRSVSPASKRVLPGNRAANGRPGSGTGLMRVAPQGEGQNRVPPRRHRAGELHSRLESPATKQQNPLASDPPSSEQQAAAAPCENGDDEETLENPLVALECFIFL